MLDVERERRKKLVILSLRRTSDLLPFFPNLAEDGAKLARFAARQMPELILEVVVPAHRVRLAKLGFDKQPMTRFVSCWESRNVL
ncbi:MAG: hypothetical protein WDN28_31860 [Chthoniobacter sp.]